MKSFESEEQKAFWEAFCYGPKGVKGNPLIIGEFVAMEHERRARQIDLSDLTR